MLLHALRRRHSRSEMRLCLLAATTLLTIAQLLHQYGIMQPALAGRLLGLSSRLTEAGLHAWRSRRPPQEARQ